MATKSLYLALLFLTVVFSLSLINASVVVTYNAYSDIINLDGSTTYTVNPISGFYVVGYICTSINCSTVSTKFLETTYVSGNSFQITYPTVLQSSYGYGVYFYKEGYLGWEVAANWAGTGTVAQPRNVYFAKKASCTAPITSLSVLNEVNPNRLIEINVSAMIDAQTYSAISNSGPLLYNPAEISSFKRVNTSVTLEIRNSQNQLIKSETQNFQIRYSGMQNLVFNHTFDQIGSYIVSVSSNVEDPKCLSSVIQEAESNTRVIEQNKTNYSYAIINDLVYSPLVPRVNETILFDFSYLANYVSNEDLLSPVNATIFADFYNGPSLVQSFNYSVSPISTNFTSFNFNTSFVSPGDYVLNLKVIPQLIGNETISAEQNLTFRILDAQQNDTNQTNVTLPVINVLSPVNGHTYDTHNILLNATSNQPVIWTYSLNGNANVTFIPAITISASEGANTLVVYGSNSNGTSSVSINFHVDTNDNDDDDEDDEDKDNKNDDDTYFSTLDSSNDLDVIHLTKPKDYSLLRIFIYWLLILILILAIIIVSFYIYKFM